MASKKQWALRAGGAAICTLVIGGLMGTLWAERAQARRLNQVFEAHEHELPIPWDGDEAATLARGKHLVQSRYGCIDCHGEDFGGGTMIDDPLVGEVLGPNLTRGTGSRTLNYTASDWDRMVRHGIKPDGRPTLMPSTDFVAMSDQELSDIILWIQRLPPVNNEVPAVQLGPLGTLFVANSTFRMTAEELPDHHGAHRALPPGEDDPVALGAHLAQVCTGCHGADFTGGPIPGGPPDWPEAADLTRSGPLVDYDFAAFERTMRQGVRPEGAEVQPPMTLAVGLAAHMTEAELRALFAHLKGL